MSEFSPVPSESDYGDRSHGTGSVLRTWFGVRDEVPQRLYALSGIGLMLLKYVIEMGAILYFIGNVLAPWDFLNPLLSSRAALLEPGPEWLAWALFVWNLPFVWIAFSMSVRRAADAGWSPWSGLLVLIPVLNLFVMIGFALLPSDPQDHWRPQSTRNRGDQASDADYRRGLLAIGVGLLVGLTMLGISVYAFRLYGATLFFGTSLMMGASAGFIYNRPRPQSWLRTFGIASFLMFVAAGVLLLFALEGLICIAMAVPLVLPLGWIGSAIGKGIADSTNTSLANTLSVLIMLPILTGAEALYHPAPENMVFTSVEIDAPPEIVWQNVIHFPDLPDAEEWYFRAGIACPVRARIEGHGVGAVRYCEFTTGSFVEPITVWDEPRRLAFDVTEQPDPMVEFSPYRHVHPPHLEHSHLRSDRGEFRLIALPGNRTRLEGRTWYTFEMFPQSYWTLWSDTSIHRIHQRVLRHIKHLSENAREA